MADNAEKSKISNYTLYRNTIVKNKTGLLDLKDLEESLSLNGYFVLFPKFDPEIVEKIKEFLLPKLVRVGSVAEFEKFKQKMIRQYAADYVARVFLQESAKLRPIKGYSLLDLNMFPAQDYGMASWDLERHRRQDDCFVIPEAQKLPLEIVCGINTLIFTRVHFIIVATTREHPSFYTAQGEFIETTHDYTALYFD